jgi:hypothetical protein
VPRYKIPIIDCLGVNGLFSWLVVHLITHSFFEFLIHSCYGLCMGNESKEEKIHCLLDVINYLLFQ